MYSDFPKYSFKLQYFDEQSGLTLYYILIYYTERTEIEIYDVKNRRMFLRKTPIHNIKMSDLYIGSKILINGRQYEIIDFSDEFTRKSLSEKMQHTLGIIKSGYSRYLGEVLDSIYSNSLSVSQLQFGSISKEIGISLLKEHRKEQTFENLLNSITKDSIIAIDIVGNNSILKWKEIIERKFWNEICYGSETLTSSTYEIEIIFNQRNLQIKSLIDGTTTLCLIKPHAIKSGVSGKIIQQILKNGFEIVGAMMTTFNIEEASEFFEIYRGVVDNYYEISRDLASGPILALELYKEDAVNSLREICGPRDVSIAKAIRPQSIRALYGINNIQNAVHCTDLKEESQIECEFFFNLLSN